MAALISDRPDAIRRAAVLAVLLGVFASAMVGAANNVAAVTPVGLWTTIDDNSGHPRARVEISETDGTLSGHIVRLFVEPGEDPDPHCAKCTDARRDQRVIGMQILSGLQRHGSEWSGGEILDPESGSVYRVTIRPSDDGQRLDVRGYIGISLLGRTQVWRRDGPAPP